MGLPGAVRGVRRAPHDGCQIELGPLVGVRDEVPDLEGALEVLRGLGEGRGPLGLEAGLHVGGERLGHAVRRLPVVGQLGRGRRAREGRVLAQRLGERQVQRGPLARQQVRVGGLFEQGVAEGVAVAVVDEDVMSHGLAQRLEQRSLGQGRDGREQPMARLRPGGRGDAQHRTRILWQGLQPQVEDLAQGRRQRAGRAARGGQQLLGEERVALAAGVQPRDQSGIGGVAEDARDLRRELGGREGLELDALHPFAALLLGHERPQRVAAVQLVAAVGADEQHALVAHAAQQRREELERRAVGPMQVLDREQDGRVGRQAVEQPAQHAEQPGLGERVAGRGRIALRRRRAPLGHEPRQLAARRADQRLEGLRRELAFEPSQRRGDGRIGQLAGAEGGALAAQHARPAIGGAPLELAQQPRLADARLAADEGRARHAALGSREGRLEARELRCATDELRARDARWHMASISARHGHGEGAHDDL